MEKLTAMMAGSVWKLLVSEGDQLNSDQDFVILESMKMEIPHTSTYSCRVVKTYVNEGDFVNEGDPLIEVEKL
ncbi:acetyl-CoA carboxylase biotin carboxyl carrier protein subunit [Bacillus sp. RG28]|jgi:acetyl-CoA carboxylase biotin carboxyl carrier protein|uniref:Acetyl-CoA carboxylase biotin carboxyl carrier protein subunit n=1 Tax=Gottfriedia endophytica TaxID=2820819 RepID=A0A940NPJ7_9BACI|nr:acetyl-CoA carboxylase biotin carboxyl carrier protein subunit [Gottfriedia endophytica]MBP0726411.1 acetyl-CoA carboxylase biotin carboxyl carrier protein subunit [Gottfriedia endophytica]